MLGFLGVHSNLASVQVRDHYPVLSPLANILCLLFYLRGDTCA